MRDARSAALAAVWAMVAGVGCGAPDDAVADLPSAAPGPSSSDDAPGEQDEVDDCAPGSQRGRDPGASQCGGDDDPAEPEAAGCVLDADCCPEGLDCEQACDTSRSPGVCVEGLRCSANYDCLQNADRYCFRDVLEPLGVGQCRTRCDQGGACPVEHQCSVDGSCALTGAQVGDPGSAECERDEHCLAMGRGCSCVEVVPGYGACQDCPCEAQGQAGACADDAQACDFVAGGEPGALECQSPCARREDSACPSEMFCHPDDPAGLCRGVDGARGCMSSLSCGEGQCCDRRGALPQCDVDACPADLCGASLPCGQGSLCVDDGCIAEANSPVLCRDHDDCPGLQTCSADGRCESSGGCTRNVDCPGRGELRCVQETGLCVACESERDCQAPGDGVVCGPSADVAAGVVRCLELQGGFCEDDAQCVGRRACMAGLCAPDPEQPCEDDWMGRAFASAEAMASMPVVLGNHSAATAAEVGAQTYTGLVICDGRDDWFGVAVDEGRTVEAAVLWDINGPGAPWLSAQVEPLGDGRWGIHVHGAAGISRTEYILRLDTVAEEPVVEGEANE